MIDGGATNFEEIAFDASINKKYNIIHSLYEQKLIY
jgi:hypothetical protein